ncbi:ABC transporter permease [Actinospongicola halichondriae]|uniref:ABC transporter permease n=1 Tax=Actinospongicola halichondriae TaxID=3236844 RepID=UPI003D47FA0B
MFRTTIKDLAARKLRLLTTSIAVLLGVAFMAGTLVLTDTIGATFDGLFADVNSGTDAYVRGEAAFDNADFGAQRARLDSSLADTIRSVDGVVVAEPSIEAYTQIVDKDGGAMGDPDMGAPTFGGNWLTDDSLNPFELASGRAPEAAGEVVIDQGSAKAADFAVGDRTTVITQAGEQPVEIVGIATFGGADSPGGASYTLFTLDAAQDALTAPGKVDAIKVVAADGVSDEQVVERIAEVVPDEVEVLTGAEITAEDQADIKEGLGFFNTFLLTFALIALFVGSFIIYNSFSILVAQRSRDMALLRAIGASRRQVLASVLFEAVVVGAIASVVGLAAGIGVAAGLKALLDGMGIDVPAGDIVITSGTVITSMIAGLGVSVVSAFFPARRAANVAPIAAMRDVAVDSSGSSRSRAVIGSVVTVLGAASIANGLFSGGDSAIAAVGLGVMLVFLGVAVLGPIVARPLSRLLGSPLPRLRGVSGTLARENAMRNPKRTSATAAALMIGVALVGFITILASSVKASIADTVDNAFVGDLVIDSGFWADGGFNPDLAASIAALPEVDAVGNLRNVPAEIDGSGAMLVGFDPQTMDQLFDLDVEQGSFAELGSSEIAVQADEASDHGWELGDTVPVRFAETGVQELTIVATYGDHDVIGPYGVANAVMEANVADQFDQMVFMDLADGVDIDAGTAAVEAAVASNPLAEVQDRDAFKDSKGAEIDTILNLIYVLLALAVIIALLGIANTLALSIFERTRELGLLRAVGMTRAQLRATVRWESVIISLLGTTLGLVIGVGFGWVMVEALESEGISTFVVPGGQLAVMVVIAAMAGVGAAILPARRAARLDVLEAIASA